MTLALGRPHRYPVALWRRVSFEPPTPGRPGGPLLGEVSVLLPISQASQVWLDALVQQASLDQLVLTVVDNLEPRAVRWTYTLHNARLTSWTTCSSNFGAIPTEGLTLSYESSTCSTAPATLRKTSSPRSPSPTTSGAACVGPVRLRRRGPQ